MISGGGSGWIGVDGENSVTVFLGGIQVVVGLVGTVMGVAGVSRCGGAIVGGGMGACWGRSSASMSG